MIAFILPTRDRPEHLARTLAAIGSLSPRLARDGGCVIVVDNAPAKPARCPARLDNALPVRLINSTENLGAAARNLAAHEAPPHCQWLVMLDDDSYPLGDGLLAALGDAPADALAVAAEIFLPPGDAGSASPRREAGGLPEVFVGCGVALRREAFVASGGYDPSFGYYAEEYDLAAKLLLAGGRVVLDRRFAVLHEKTAAGRDMDRILGRLVRNNGWVIDRYAPDDQRSWHLSHTIERYGAIADKEGARAGYEQGLAEFRGTVGARARRPMPGALWDRFTGLASARAALLAEHARTPLGRCAVVAPGKNQWAVHQALAELAAADRRVQLTESPDGADTLVIGTLSPGPMLDAADELARAHPGRRVAAPMAFTPEPAAQPGRARPR